MNTAAETRVKFCRWADSIPAGRFEACAGEYGSFPGFGVSLHAEHTGLGSSACTLAAAVKALLRGTRTECAHTSVQNSNARYQASTLQSSSPGPHEGLVTCSSLLPLKDLSRICPAPGAAALNAVRRSEATFTVCSTAVKHQLCQLCSAAWWERTALCASANPQPSVGGTALPSAGRDSKPGLTCMYF